MKIIFMGTPDFAVPTLEVLSKHHEVIAVYTQAQKPAGRGHKETLSPIHILANNLNIPVYTPKTLRRVESQTEFAALGADVAVVIAYGLILPKEILTACKYGCINIHPSLLPFYRGAAPMQKTILSGEKETAMCIMQMDEGVDTGDVLLMQKMQLDDQITYLELSKEMSHLGATILLKVLDNIDNIIPQKQPKEGSYANKLTKEDGELNWQESCEVLHRKVRALNPWPGTSLNINGERIKVLEAKIDNIEHQYKPGTIVDSKQLIIACGKGFFIPTIVQRPGK
ncbi:MAG: methionyl-tRNA formyltransferase, partial [Pseudomonadota bacterium]